MQSAFYAEALKRAGLTGELKTFAQTVGGHEQAHIAFLKKALGSAARKSPKLDFGDDTADAEQLRRWRRSSSRTSASPRTTRRRRT